MVKEKCRWAVLTPACCRDSAPVAPRTEDAGSIVDVFRATRSGTEHRDTLVPDGAKFIG
jgi:hypothetical protein